MTSLSLREVVPMAIAGGDFCELERLASARLCLRPGEALFAAGDRFCSLYAVHSGSFKTTLVDPEGRQQVTGFFMGGDLLGLDGMGTSRYHATATALECSQVCALPHSLIDELTRRMPGLRRYLYAALSREIVREQSLMLLLGSMRAEARVAAFLLGLSTRFAQRGYSPSAFRLCMTREETGSYLGLTVETVSRLFARLQRDGTIELGRRRVRLLDARRLEAMTASAPGRFSRS